MADPTLMFWSTDPARRNRIADVSKYSEQDATIAQHSRELIVRERQDSIPPAPPKSGTEDATLNSLLRDSGDREDH